MSFLARLLAPRAGGERQRMTPVVLTWAQRSSQVRTQVPRPDTQLSSALATSAKGWLYDQLDQISKGR